MIVKVHYYSINLNIFYSILTLKEKEEYIYKLIITVVKYITQWSIINTNKYIRITYKTFIKKILIDKCSQL